MNENLWQIIGLAFVTITGLVGVVWTMLHAKINEHRDSLKERLDMQRLNLEKQISDSYSALDARIKEANSEADTQRGHIAKIFDKLEVMRSESQSQHIQLLNAFHAGLDKKADR